MSNTGKTIGIMLIKGTLVGSVISAAFAVGAIYGEQQDCALQTMTCDDVPGQCSAPVYLDDKKVPPPNP